jgi:hypothetical protein
VLAGVEEAVSGRKPQEVKQTISAIDSLLAGLIDYAGLYPPAGLDMRTAVRNYLAYQQGRHAAVLGRFVVNLDRIDELRMVAGGDLSKVKLSVIIPTNADCDRVSALIDDGVPIEAIEMKIQLTSEMAGLRKKVPVNVEEYFELGPGSIEPEILRAIAAARARVKLRMGGVTAEAFQTTAVVARVLKSVAGHGLAFKATAGLHHPIRSRHPFTYASDSPTGWMHGFVNLVCAAALIHSGGNVDDAKAVLDEQDPASWRSTPDGIAWRSHVWNADHLSRTREEFFISFGSCSFEEPVRDLEALGWL